MSQSIPKTTKAWTVTATKDFDGLKFDKQTAVPSLSDNEVLVKFHAASLNYRDLVIAKGLYPFGARDGAIPGSDGAGEVVAVGSKVNRFKAGDKVVTLFNQAHLGGPMTPEIQTAGLGGILDGTLRQYGTLNENGLVPMPTTLTYEEAATLTCAGVTAWNALYGLKPVKAGDVVLTQGTGGVSIFALQFAKAAGATVIATTSSAKKAELLKKMGADHIINYKDDPNWGKTAKALTPKGYGVNHVVEIGGPGTMAQSLEATAIEGTISVIGFLAQGGDQPTFLEALSRNIIVRGIIVGSRVLHEEMNRAIDANKIKPAVDEKVFSLDQLKEAYQYAWDQKHFGKVVIKIE